MRGTNLIFLAGTVFTIATEASAFQLIQSYGGDVEVLAMPPANVTLENVTSNSAIRVFEERRSHALSQQLDVDFTEFGTYNQNNATVPGVIAAGTVVNSHLIHFDTVGTASATLSGSIDFSVPILGVIFSDPSMPNGPMLNNSDCELGAVETSYPTFGGMGSESRGWELGPLSEITLTATRRTLRFEARVEQALDQIRVITGNCTRTIDGSPPLGGNCPVNLTIAADNLDYEGCDIVVIGCADLTIEGEHSFNSLTVLGTSVIRSAFEVPTVLNVASDLVVDANASIDVSGRGHAEEQGLGAGQGGGAWPCVQLQGGGGGGYGGSGGNGVNGAGGSVYGSVTEPFDLGSGGGHAFGDAGGRGGGALHLVVGGTLTINGQIAANGVRGASNCDFGGAGSGGSIWIDATTIAGDGSLTADGGDANSAHDGAGGGGRIAIYYDSDLSSLTMSARGGLGAGGIRTGGAGTIYRKQNAESLGIALIDNGGAAGAKTPWTGAPASIRDMTVSGAADVVIEGEDWFESLTITNAGIVRSAFEVPTVLNVASDLVVDANASIDVSGRGHAEEQGLGAGQGGGAWPCVQLQGGGGGGYGGSGGNGVNGAGGSVYGSVTEPFDLGSGGGHAFGDAGGRGGGALHLVVGGTLTINGQIAANGVRGASNCDFGGAGSGGSIWIDATTIAGDGSLTADGGDANSAHDGAGGGGRIAVFSCVDDSSWEFQASGGVNAVNSSRSGEDGTIHVGAWICVGDLNCDRALNGLDLAAFSLALTDPSQYASRYPDCTVDLGDINGDRVIDSLDIEAFVSQLLP